LPKPCLLLVKMNGSPRSVGVEVTIRKFSSHRPGSSRWPPPRSPGIDIAAPAIGWPLLWSGPPWCGSARGRLASGWGRRRRPTASGVADTTTAPAITSDTTRRRRIPGISPRYAAQQSGPLRSNSTYSKATSLCESTTPRAIAPRSGHHPLATRLLPRHQVEVTTRPECDALRRARLGDLAAAPPKVPTRVPERVNSATWFAWQARHTDIPSPQRCRRPGGGDQLVHSDGSASSAPPAAMRRSDRCRHSRRCRPRQSRRCPPRSLGEPSLPVLAPWSELRARLLKTARSLPLLLVA